VIRLRISRRTLRTVTGIVLAVAGLAGLYGLGVVVTPQDEGGHPLILSPSLRATERYRSRVRGWAARMADLDGRLTALLGEETTAGQMELYTQSQEMQEIGETAANLAHETDVVEVPVALVALRQQVRAAAAGYLESALLTARWLGAPSEEGRRQALEVLRAARALRVQIERSRWLTTDWRR
jgi:hypothetical protein